MSESTVVRGESSMVPARPPMTIEPHMRDDEPPDQGFEIRHLTSWRRPASRSTAIMLRTLPSTGRRS